MLICQLLTLGSERRLIGLAMNGLELDLWGGQGITVKRVGVSDSSLEAQGNTKDLLNNFYCDFLTGKSWSGSVATKAGLLKPTRPGLRS